MRFFDLLEGVNTNGEIYEALALAAPRVRPRHRVLARMLTRRHPQGSTGLDLGCGVSHVSRLLGPEHRVTAVDRALRNDDAPAHVRFVDADILVLRDADLPTAGFDWILVDNVLEHLPRFEELLAHCSHWLATGGRVLVCVPNGATLRRLLGGRHRREVYRPVEHVNIFERRTLDRALARAGLQPKAWALLPRSPFEAGVAASLLGWAPFGLYRSYGAPDPRHDGRNDGRSAGS